jgi:hypothetical protein
VEHLLRHVCHADPDEGRAHAERVAEEVTRFRENAERARRVREHFGVDALLRDLEPGR